MRLGMRVLAIVCLGVTISLSGCASERHIVQRLWAPNTVDPEGKPLPSWVRYNDFPDKHPYLTVGIITTTLVTIAAVGVTLAVLANCPC
jgi:hypothetical protein